jgi:hypothetical protein
MVSINASGTEINQRHGDLAGTQSASEIPGPAVNVCRFGLSGLGLSRWQVDDRSLQYRCDAPNRLSMIEIKPKRAMSARNKCGPDLRSDALGGRAAHHNQPGTMLLRWAR